MDKFVPALLHDDLFSMPILYYSKVNYGTLMSASLVCGLQKIVIYGPKWRFPPCMPKV